MTPPPHVPSRDGSAGELSVRDLTARLARRVDQARHTTDQAGSDPRTATPAADLLSQEQAADLLSQEQQASTQLRRPAPPGAPATYHSSIGVVGLTRRLPSLAEALVTDYRQRRRPTNPAADQQPDTMPEPDRS